MHTAGAAWLDPPENFPPRGREPPYPRADCGETMATATNRMKSASRKSSRRQGMSLGASSTKRRSGRRTATKTLRRAKAAAKPKRRAAAKGRRSPARSR